MTVYHVDNGLIKDADNNPIMLRGVHMYVCKQNEQEKYTKAATMGANVVRLAFWKNAVEGYGASGSPCSDGIASLDAAIGYAKNAGLRVILDDHFWSYLGSTATEWPPYTFFTDQNLIQSWFDMWLMLADRYKNNDTVIGIDPYNEPYAITGTQVGDYAYWEPMVENLIDQLAVVNPNLLFFPSGWGSLTSLWHDMDYLAATPNIVLQEHIYLNVKTAEWFTARYTPYINAGIPIMLGEVGWTLVPDETSWMDARLDFFDSLGLHYCLFCFGVGSWNLAWDVAPSSPYTLNTIGEIYKDHLERMAKMSTTVNLTGISSGNLATDPVTVTAVADKPLLFDSIVVNYVSPQATGNIVLTPKVDAEGVAVITVTVKNDKPTKNTTVKTFKATLVKLGVPAIDNIADVTVYS